jgi:hypothetical protein
MDLKHKLVGAGAALLAVAGFGTATAAAQTSGPSAPASHGSPSAVVTTPEPVHGADTDNVQQGDQSTPDGPETDHAERTDGKADAPETGDQADPAETNQSGGGAGTGDVTDGSGGHQDPPGNIDNQQSGQN